MKTCKISKLAGFLSVAIIGSSLFSGCSLLDNQSEEKTVEDKSKEEDSLIYQCNLHYISKNYNEAFKYCKRAAEEGISDAQFTLGLMYYDGQGVKQDYSEAQKWFQKAAEQGYAYAQYDLGLMYYNGEGVKQDYFKAIELWQKASKQRNARAQYNLGVMYAKGQGVRQNYTKAKEYFGLACDNKYQAGCDMYRKLNQ